MERAAQPSQHTDETVRRLEHQISNITRELNGSASKEDIYHLQHSKADAVEHHKLQTAMSDMVNKQDMQQVISQHMQPLVATITALEKLVTMSQQQQPTNSKQQWSYDKIQTIVDDTLRARHLGEVSEVQLETSIGEMRELLLREIAVQVESARGDTEEVARDIAQSMKKQLESKIAESTRITHEARSSFIC